MAEPLPHRDAPRPEWEPRVWHRAERIFLRPGVTWPEAVAAALACPRHAIRGPERRAQNAARVGPVVAARWIADGAGDPLPRRMFEAKLTWCPMGVRARHDEVRAHLAEPARLP